jgi:Beta-galactosidase/beta-glucuronidase
LPLKQFENHKAGWKVYAGITRSVKLEILPKNYIFYAKVESSNEKIKCQVISQGDIKNLHCKLVDDGKILAQANFSSQQIDDYSKFEVSFNNLNLESWSQTNPKLYTIEFDSKQEKKTVKFGVKSFVAKNSQLTFNNEKFILKGVCIHEEDIKKGSCLNLKDISNLYSYPVDLGCNFVRLVHYPHSENVFNFLDKNGLLSWCEVPNYQAGLGLIQKVFGKSIEISGKKKGIKETLETFATTNQFLDEEYIQNTMLSIAKMVISKFNRASISVWGVGNECYSFTPASGKILKLLKKTVEDFDKTRLVGYAAFTIPFITPIFEKSFKIFDIVTANEYYGWYYGNFDDAKKYWKSLSKFKKPMFITETGSDSRVDSDDIDLINKNKNSQKYQIDMLNAHFNLINDVKGFCGTCVWMIKDCFCEEYGEKDIVPFCNPKGLISKDYKKKNAYIFVKQWNEKH